MWGRDVLIVCGGTVARKGKDVGSLLWASWDMGSRVNHQMSASRRGLSEADQPCPSI
jgi:hypothetical protein